MTGAIIPRKLFPILLPKTAFPAFLTLEKILLRHDKKPGDSLFFNQKTKNNVHLFLTFLTCIENQSVGESETTLYKTLLFKCFYDESHK